MGGYQCSRGADINSSMHRAAWLDRGRPCSRLELRKLGLGGNGFELVFLEGAENFVFVFVNLRHLTDLD